MKDERRIGGYLPGLVLLSMSSMVSFGADATTYVPPRPDPWYVISFKLDPASLPPGTRIEQRESKASHYAGVKRADYLVNDSEIPLIIVRESSEPVDWLQHLPHDVIPAYKAQNDKAYEWTYYAGDWRSLDYGRLRGGVPLFQQYQEVKTILGERGPGRPDLLPRKDDYVVDVRGYYADIYTPIKVRISFSRNPDYDPTWTRGQKAFWYVADRFSLEGKDVPAGLEVGKRNPSLPAARHQFVLRNRSDTPFYVVVKSTKPIAWRSQYPTNVIPIKRLQNGKTFSSIPPKEVTWVEGRTRFHQPRNIFGPPQELDYWWEDFRESFLLMPNHLASAGLISETGQVVADGRPENHKPPEPRQIEIKARYGDQPVTILGSLRYELNPDYDPLASAGEPQLASCTGFTCPGAFSGMLRVTAYSLFLMILVTRVSRRFFRSDSAINMRRMSTPLLFGVNLFAMGAAFVGFILVYQLTYAFSLSVLFLRGDPLAVAIVVTSVVGCLAIISIPYGVTRATVLKSYVVALAMAESLGLVLLPGLKI